MKKAASLSLLGIMIFVSLIPQVAEGSTVQTQNTDRQLLTTIQLQPEAGTQVVIPNFQLEKYSDGSVTITSEGDRTIGSGILLFDFQVDINNGTYKTFLLDPDQYPEKDKEDEKISNDEPAPGYVISRWWPES